MWTLQNFIVYFYGPWVQKERCFKSHTRDGALSLGTKSQEAESEVVQNTVPSFLHLSGEIW